LAALKKPLTPWQDAIVEKEVLHPTSAKQSGAEEHGEPIIKEPFTDQDLQLAALSKSRRKKPLTPWQEAVATPTPR
jgi:hypothetical protein